ncbi:MAG: voltage-gated potassium channel Kch [Oceanicoccus sp.]|jgi:voltage-gated potassium channel Kch
MSDPDFCPYQPLDGTRCENEPSDDGWCFWHSVSIDKKGMLLKEKLEAYAKSGGTLQGLQLKHANLEGINLVSHVLKNGYDLSGSDLYRANLRGAHLFNITLDHGSLMKADLSGANLHFGKFRETNLLGVNLDGSKIDHIDIGRKLIQESQAASAASSGSTIEAIDLYEQAEEIFRSLRKSAEQQGLYALGGDYIRRELTMRRYCYPLFSIDRLKSKGVDIFCGYGESPGNVVIFSLALIFVCACMYFVLGLNFENQILVLDTHKTFFENGRNFLMSLYFSTVTFTTLGYGDVTPVGGARAVAALEAFAGGFTLALFVVVFVKKMTR